MTTSEWVLLAVLGVMLAAAAVAFVVSWWQDRRYEAAHRERMNNPEYAAAYHESHKYDDWEDLGYFDGR